VHACVGESPPCRCILCSCWTGTNDGPRVNGKTKQHRGLQQSPDEEQHRPQRSASCRTTSQSARCFFSLLCHPGGSRGQARHQVPLLRIVSFFHENRLVSISFSILLKNHKTIYKITKGENKRKHFNPIHIRLGSES
jgi:hypothetical protein